MQVCCGISSCADGRASSLLYAGTQGSSSSTSGGMGGCVGAGVAVGASVGVAVTTGAGVAVGASVGGTAEAASSDASTASITAERKTEYTTRQVFSITPDPRQPDSSKSIAASSSIQRSFFPVFIRFASTMVMHSSAFRTRRAACDAPLPPVRMLRRRRRVLHHGS